MGFADLSRAPGATIVLRAAVFEISATTAQPVALQASLVRF